MTTQAAILKNFRSEDWAPFGGRHPVSGVYRYLLDGWNRCPLFVCCICYFYESTNRKTSFDVVLLNHIFEKNRIDEHIRK